MRREAVFAALLIAVGLFGNAPAFGQDAAEAMQPRTVDIAALVTQAAQRFGLPEHWIYAVMHTESAGKIGAVSPAGAMGLMQLMPATWARQRAQFILGNDPFDPRDNILAGTSYLRELYDSYGAPGFLAAYNAGAERYEQWRDHGRRLPAETRAYVAKIAPRLQTPSAAMMQSSTLPVQPVRVSWAQSQLFTTRANSSDGASGSVAPPASSYPANALNALPGGLFAPVSGTSSR